MGDARAAIVVVVVVGPPTPAGGGVADRVIEGTVVLVAGGATVDAVVATVVLETGIVARAVVVGGEETGTVEVVAGLAGTEVWDEASGARESREIERALAAVEGSAGLVVAGATEAANSVAGATTATLSAEAGGGA
jgi:hypothetical protein